MAKPFTFRPQTLLKLRKRQQDESCGAVEQCRLAVSAIEDDMAALSNARKAFDAAARAAISHGQADSARAYGALSAQADGSIRQHAARLRQAQADLAQKRADLLAAMRSRKALESLRDKLLARFRSQSQRRATKELDDAHASGASTRRNAGF